MKLVVIGGYGAFGRRLIERIASNDTLNITVAGRDIDKAKQLAAEISEMPDTKAHIEARCIDATDCTSDKLREVGASVVVNASGPFQAQNYHLARSAIAAGCHYIDLADAREFVVGITTLDKEARAADAVVLSGASTVPGLSSAVVQQYRPKFERLKSVEIFISPGNKYDPGIATTKSILGYVGHAIKVRRNGKSDFVYGWQGIARHLVPGIGKRWAGHVDVPDHDLFPDAYPDLKTVTIKAGLEVGFYHIGLWTLSWLVRAGLVRSLATLATPLVNVKHALSWLGTDTGGMAVTMRGEDETGALRVIEWSLAAKSGDGPTIPTLAAQILINRLAAGEHIQPGARPCFEVVSLEDFEDAIKGLDIRFNVV